MPPSRTAIKYDGLLQAALSLAGYRRPEAAVVSFWPRAELDWLRGWLASGRRPDVALVPGQAGAGKTRLALQLADETGQHLGWRYCWVPAGGEEQVMRPTMQSRKPVLVVCEYAGTRPGCVYRTYGDSRAQPPEAGSVSGVPLAQRWHFPAGHVWPEISPAA